jgi:predicted DCC family thiol-disulfide oxidoreductase YuxK
MGAAIEIEEISEVILYDGVCNFCNSTVNFIIKNENSKELNFASLQSEFSSELAKNYNFDNTQLKTIVFVQNGRAYLKSKAIFRIVAYLKLPWSLFSIFSLLPIKFTDFFYDFISKNRYRIFGKSESCIVPTSELKSRFLDSH